MSILSSILPIVQIVISAAMIAAILLQQRGGGLGAVFGGSDASYHTKRGFEKALFIITVVLAVFFILTSIGILILE